MTSPGRRWAARWDLAHSAVTAWVPIMPPWLCIATRTSVPCTSMRGGGDGADEVGAVVERESGQARAVGGGARARGWVAVGLEEGRQGQVVRGVVPGAVGEEDGGLTGRRRQSGSGNRSGLGGGMGRHWLY